MELLFIYLLDYKTFSEKCHKHVELQFEKLHIYYESTTMQSNSQIHVDFLYTVDQSEYSHNTLCIQDLTVAIKRKQCNNRLLSKSFDY